MAIVDCRRCHVSVTPSLMGQCPVCREHLRTALMRSDCAASHSGMCYRQPECHPGKCPYRQPYPIAAPTLVQERVSTSGSTVEASERRRRVLERMLRMSCNAPGWSWGWYSWLLCRHAQTTSMSWEHWTVRCEQMTTPAIPR